VDLIVVLSLATPKLSQFPVLTKRRNFQGHDFRTWPDPECARKLAKNRRCKSPTGKV